MTGGPCGWTLDWSTTSCSASGTDADKVIAETLAAGLLWRLTGRVFGVCQHTVRPSGEQQHHSSTYHGPSTARLYFGLLQQPCNCTPGCSGVHEVALPDPIVSVTEVWVDGVQLDAADYKIRDSKWLLRVDGASWPTRQDLTAGDHDPGAFTVVYQQGTPLPPDGEIAFADLACEFLRARTGGPCKIPSRAQSVARQGIDIQLIDPTVLYEAGLTGVDSVDRWIASVNPTRVRSRSRVYSPDIPRVTRLS